MFGFEGGEDEEAAGFEGGAEFGFKSHADDGAGGDPDDGLLASEEDAQTLPFHRRVESADYGAAFVAHGRDRIEGLENHTSGALGGTEKCGVIALQNARLASRPNRDRSGCSVDVKQRSYDPFVRQADGREFGVQDYGSHHSSSASAPRRYLMS